MAHLLVLWKKHHELLKAATAIKVVRFSIYFNADCLGHGQAREHNANQVHLTNCAWGLCVVVHVVVLYRSIFSNVKMTSWHGSFSQVTGSLYGEFTGHRWIPLKMTSNAEFDVFLCDLRLHNFDGGRHCNGLSFYQLSLKQSHNWINLTTALLPGNEPWKKMVKCITWVLQDLTHRRRVTPICGNKHHVLI